MENINLGNKGQTIVNELKSKIPTDLTNIQNNLGNVVPGISELNKFGDAKNKFDAFTGGAKNMLSGAQGKAKEMADKLKSIKKPNVPNFKGVMKPPPFKPLKPFKLAEAPKPNILKNREKLAMKAKGGIESVKNMANKAKGLTSQAQGLASKAQGLASQAQGLASQAQGLASKAQGLGGNLQSQIGNITSQIPNLPK